MAQLAWSDENTIGCGFFLEHRRSSQSHWHGADTIAAIPRLDLWGVVIQRFSSQRCFYQHRLLDGRSLPRTWHHQYRLACVDTTWFSTIGLTTGFHTSGGGQWQKRRHSQALGLWMDWNRSCGGSHQPTNGRPSSVCDAERRLDREWIWYSLRLCGLTQPFQLKTKIWLQSAPQRIPTANLSWIVLWGNVSKLNGKYLHIAQ